MKQSEYPNESSEMWAEYKQHFKELRNERHKKFTNDIVPILKSKYTIEYYSDYHRYRIFTNQIGVLDFYPKANKIFLHQDAKWVRNGLEFIIKNLLNI